jgi:hypothetical protein
VLGSCCQYRHLVIEMFYDVQQQGRFELTKLSGKPASDVSMNQDSFRGVQSFEQRSHGVNSNNVVATGFKFSKGKARSTADVDDSRPWCEPCSS